MSFTPREARGIVRKAVKRVPEGEEIRHLNIMPMMDMMTILLVAFIFQASVTSAALTSASVVLPHSMSDEPLPENASTLIITSQAITLVYGNDAEEIVGVKEGTVDAAEKDGGARGYKILRLSRALGALRQAEVASAIEHNKEPAKIPELLIIADRATPFRLLFDVIFSAKEKESGYKRFRLIVQKHSLN
jgi:biopolymer transport protein ExbD